MLSTTLNQSHLYGVDQENLILPVRARDEEQQPTSQESMFNFVRLSDGGFDRIPQLWSEVEIIARLAGQVVPSGVVDFNSFLDHREIRQLIARLIPGFERLETLDDSREEFHIDGRHLDRPTFPTPDGRATFLIPAIWPDLSADGEHEFLLTTVRSEGQFNTIIFNDKDVYRRQSHRQVLFMSRVDRDRLGLKEGDVVTVSNATGTMTGLKVAEFDIHAGNVMTYFPEANVLIPQETDQRSCTPAFKSVPVTVRPAAEARDSVSCD